MKPNFVFSSSNFNKKVKHSKTTKEKLTSIIEKNVIAVCFFDLEKLWYVVPIDLEKLELKDRFYKFTPDSYKVKDGKTRYSTSIFDNKFISIDEINIIRRKDKVYDNNIYMPFMAGVLCKGNLIKNNITGFISFDLKNTSIDWRHPACKQSIKDYIKHYEEYKSVIEKYRNGGF